jgi:Fe2+ or Zn2+ uptake regulation protein
MQKRNTNTKQMVMNVLFGSSSALSHEDIERQLSKKMNRVSIYRILQRFCDEGKVHKIFGENGKTYYALCNSCSSEQHNDNHLHFRCTKCETISCLDEPIVPPTLPQGYSISGITYFISGHCPNCQIL